VIPYQLPLAPPPEELPPLEELLEDEELSVLRGMTLRKLQLSLQCLQL